MAESNWIDAIGDMMAGTTGDWLGAGLSASRFRRLVSSGELVRIRHGGYATRKAAAEAESDRALRHALEIAASGGTRNGQGAASHQSAALLWRLNLLGKPTDRMVTLTLPPRTRTGGFMRAGVVRHAAELPREHVTQLYGLPVTTAARTVIDIARASAFADGVVVADSALYERRASRTDLRRVLARCEGWRGSAQARRVVDFASPLAESPLESCARVAFHLHGLPPPMLQAHIFGHDGRLIGRVDFCWQQYQTIAEADGLLKYQGRDDAIAELRRDRLLREAGYDVVHFTWKELFAEPARVVMRIRAAFGRAMPLGGA
jgi:predicted transcriptional regulator of viral defense system